MLHLLFLPFSTISVFQGSCRSVLWAWVQSYTQRTPTFPQCTSTTDTLRLRKQTVSVLAQSFEAVRREMLLSVTTTHHVLYLSYSLSQAQSSGGLVEERISLLFILIWKMPPISTRLWRKHVRSTILSITQTSKSGRILITVVCSLNGVCYSCYGCEDERFISWVDLNCSAMIRFPIICCSYCFVFVSQHF